MLYNRLIWNSTDLVCSPNFNEFKLELTKLLLAGEEKLIFKCFLVFSVLFFFFWPKNNILLSFLSLTVWHFAFNLSGRWTSVALCVHVLGFCFELLLLNAFKVVVSRKYCICHVKFCKTLFSFHCCALIHLFIHSGCLVAINRITIEIQLKVVAVGEVVWSKTNKNINCKNSSRHQKVFPQIKEIFYTLNISINWKTLKETFYTPVFWYFV